MKKILVFLVGIIISVSAIEQNDILEKWMNFQVDYTKSYKSLAETRNRLAIFKTTLEEIEIHNSFFENGKVLYSKGINQFSDWSSEEIANFFKNKLPKEVQSNNGVLFNKSEAYVIPASIDWREKNAVTPVQNQGILGPSVSFSVTGSIEGQLAIVKNKLIPLSEANLADCVSEKREEEIGAINAAYEYVKENGIESDKDYPDTKQKCMADPSKVITTISSSVNVQENDEDALQQAIALQGPVSALIDVTTELLMYASGIYDGATCEISVLNHAVLVVGYGNENGVDYYIIKNSWGENWGESGYFRLIRNKDNRCGIASMASYPVL